MIQQTSISLSLKRYPLLLLTTILLFGSTLPDSARQPSLPNTMIVFTIRDDQYHLGKLSIGYADLERKITGILVPEIGALSYKPSPDQNYLAYNNRILGRFARCEIRDLQSHLDIIYSTMLSKQCMPMWASDSRRVVLVSESIDNLWTATIYDTQTHTIQPSDLEFKAKDWGTWEATASPNGQTMLFKTPRSDGTYELNLLDLKSGKSRLVPVTPAYNWEFIWSPKGDKIQLIARPIPVKILIYDITSDTVHVLRKDDDATLSLTWSPDNRTVAYLVNHQKLSLFDAESNLTRLTYLPDGALLEDITWSEDPHALFLTSAAVIVYEKGKAPYRKQLALWQLDTITLQWKQLTNASEGLGWDVSPDGKNIWVTFLENGYWIQELLDLSTHKTKILSTTQRPVQKHTWSSDGQYFSWIYIDDSSPPVFYVLDVINGKVINKSTMDELNLLSEITFVGNNHFIIIYSRPNAWEFQIDKQRLLKFPDYPFYDIFAKDYGLDSDQQYFFSGYAKSDYRDIYAVNLKTAQIENLTNTPILSENMPLMVH